MYKRKPANRTARNRARALREKHADSDVFKTLVNRPPGRLRQGRDGRKRTVQRGEPRGQRRQSLAPERFEQPQFRPDPALRARVGAVARRRAAGRRRARSPPQPLAGLSRNDGHLDRRAIPPPRDSAPPTSAAARRAGGPMSPLVTSTMSGISMMPAFMNWSASPEPGCAQNTTRSAQSPISASDWPTPTVSTMTQSKRRASGPRPER